MRSIFPTVIALLLSAGMASAEGQVIEKVETYSVSGRTGPELYASIGERGPLLAGKVRSIAHTSFRLTWQRDYQRRGTACVLASAKPKLVITTVLPKAVEPLDEPVRGNWQRFVEGVTAHEKVHGTYIRDLVKEIEKATIGLVVENDPDCRKIREKMQPILGDISQSERRKSRDFDRVEMNDGGAVHRLVLQLVNGG